MALLPRVGGRDLAAGDMMCIFSPAAYSVLLRFCELFLDYEKLYDDNQLVDNINHVLVYEVIDAMPLVDIIDAIDRNTTSIDVGLSATSDSISNIVAKIDDIVVALEQVSATVGSDSSLEDNINEVVATLAAIKTIIGVVSAVA